jgi:hypothetical protein
MRPSSLHFFPLAAPFVLGLLLLAGFVIVLIEAGILGYAYAKIGVDRRYVFLLLLLSLLGSYGISRLRSCLRSRSSQGGRSPSLACGTSFPSSKSGRGRSWPSTSAGREPSTASS